MLGRSPNWLERLRRFRRSVALAVLPALVASSAVTAACTAMPLSRAAASQAAVSTPAHAEHHHAAQTAAAPGEHHHAAGVPAATAEQGTPPCPHCPSEHHTVSIPGTNCSALDSSAERAIPGGASATVVPLALAPRFVLVPMVAPPLIGSALAPHAPPGPRVPLSVRHCVWLI